MPATEPPLTGEPLLEAVTAAMIGLHERYYQRKPVTAKTLMLGDDLLACVLGGVYTDVEKTMIELQQAPVVQETRSAFQSASQQKFITAVETLSGRGVLAFISNHHVGPDIEIELFMLESAAPSELRDLLEEQRSYRVISLGDERDRAVVIEQHEAVEPAQERAVVRDRDNGSLEPFQRLLERFGGVDVEVVGGLVEQQEVVPF